MHLRAPVPFGLSLALLLLALAAPARAFSVLAHQAVIDRSWDESIVPKIRQRFPAATPDEIAQARAFAYGGSHVADLGYFPFGSRLFSDLLHYVRSGEFVTALLDDAGNVQELAFALGAASHYVADTIGHAEATNRVVPELDPDLRARYGEVVTYADSSSAHMETEFRFDVLQLARSRQSPDLFRHAIAFEIAEPLLDRAFRSTYGLGLDDVFVSTDVAITTYRWGFRELLQEATGIAWQLYQADIQRIDPQASAEQFVSSMSRADFEKQFGDSYREAGYFARAFAWLVKLVPEVGPLESLPYKALPQEAQDRFRSAFDDVLREYRAVVARARRPGTTLENRNLDTGRPSLRGDYAPADEAWAQLVETLDEHDFAAASSAVRAAVVRHYQQPARPPVLTAASRPDDGDDTAIPDDVSRALARLGSAPSRH
ncbi:zinc dependent phospholipase C family protein [Candidatus Binatia bacterium]|nr:zinc dependent phospholipase C family protein [Candidatus Binatia bacterium]